MSHVIIGTAGHIDHGKTALVKALTGVNTDRLKEEQERGLTIDLGFAHLGDHATIIDVPGHEKFIRNMVAGVSTIDLVLFVVAADDGVMPQTREHLDILKILQVKKGIIVVTKRDLVDEEWLQLVMEDIKNLVQNTFLENAPIIPVSSVTGQGIEELRRTMEDILQKVPPKPDRGIFWMPIDRAFTMKGFGTVVTGSVLSGQVEVGETLELLPQKIKVKIRGLQTHGHPVPKVKIGDRAAINLQSIEKDQIHRGNVLTAPNYFSPSQRFDARLQLLESTGKPLKSGTRVRLHFGTAEVMARVTILGAGEILRGASGYVQFFLEEPAVARRLDPFVVRQYSPTVTIGGGVILDANAIRHKASDLSLISQLKALEKEDPVEMVETTLLNKGFRPFTLENLASQTAIARTTLQEILKKLGDSKKIIFLKIEKPVTVVHNTIFQSLQEFIIKALENFHKKFPAKPGMPKAILPHHLSQKPSPDLLEYAIENLKKNKKIKENGGILALQDHTLTLSPEQQNLLNRLEEVLLSENFATSSPDALAQKLNARPEAIHEMLSIMLHMGKVVRTEANIYFHQQRVEEARQKLVNFLKKEKQITVGQFKDLLGGISRKYALPLLIHFDALQITRRLGDVRVLASEEE